MKVIIAGAGRAGLTVGAHLLSAGHDVTLVERDPAVAKQAYESYGLVALAGDATETRLLREAGIGNADVLVAMLPRDADNLAVAALGRAAGAKRVMVRVKDEHYRGIYAAAGVQRMLSETDVLIGALATAIEHENVLSSMILGNRSAVAFELLLPETSHVAGRTVSEIARHDNFPPSCVFAGLYTEQGGVEAPRGTTVVTGGVTLLLVARRDDLANVIDFFMMDALRLKALPRS